MEQLPDLSEATRDDLLAIIAAQQAVIVTLEGRVAQLEQRLGSSGGTGVPGTKPKQRSKATGQPRQARPRGYARVRMTPTETVTHAAATCSECGTALAGGTIQRRREVIDLPVTPVVVTEHQIVARTCPQCHRRVLPTDPLAGLVDGQQRFGVRLVSLIVTLREAARVPVRTIQALLTALYDLHLSLGAITAASDRVAARGAAAVHAIRAQIRGSPVVHADETGWRQTGVNGYAWSFSTPTAVYFVRRSRRKEVVDEVLGEAFDGVLVSDFYAAYHHYPGLKQRCWVHLLRDIHDLTVAYPDDAGLTTWAGQVRAVFDAAQAFGSADARTRVQAQQRCEARLAAVCAPFATDPTAVQAKLCRRIQRHLSELFVFVAHPDVPADNNAAERSVRPLVTSRKISGGARSDQGSATKMTLASLFGTWRLQGKNPLDQCRTLLTAPQL